MKNIKDLIDCELDIYITGITDDSRNVLEGHLFVATKGYNIDHYDYIGEAIDKGCSFIICDRDIKYNIPHKVVDNINDYYLELCKKFYDIDFKDYKFIGITGTDGKTTTTSIIREILDCAYIGTNGLIIGSKVYKINNTTPCISELYKCLNMIKKEGYKNVVMEVSSEALLHDRVKDFSYDIVGFTNITEDHLEVHGSFDNYKMAKLKLLGLVNNNGSIIINGDDDNLCNIKCSNITTFGFNDNNDCRILSDDNEIVIEYNEEILSINSPFIGKYNTYNIVMAYLICFKFGLKKGEILNRIKLLKQIPGRGEILDFGQNYKIVLDYAHTINGIKNILETFKNKRVITVTGCAGGRDKYKRSIIGNIVINNSYIAIFTMDDPRYEDVDNIIDDMVGENINYIRIINREEAIRYALDIANKDDIVLILGKGRDNYMAIEDKYIDYSDYDVISEYFNRGTI